MNIHSQMIKQIHDSAAPPTSSLNQATTSTQVPHARNSSDGQIQLMSAMGILPISSIQKMCSVADNSIVHTIENLL